MNKTNLVFALTCIALLAKAKPALAADDGAKSATEVESQQMDQVTALLNALAEAGAIEVTKDGRIVVKKSVSDRLRQLGRLQNDTAAFSSICSVGK